MKKILCSGLLLLCFLNFSCSKGKTDKTPDPVPPIIDPTTVIAKGADISWVTEMEAKGVKFYDKSGTQKDLFALLKKPGI